VQLHEGQQKSLQEQCTTPYSSCQNGAATIFATGVHPLWPTVAKVILHSSHNEPAGNMQVLLVPSGADGKHESSMQLHNTGRGFFHAPVLDGCTGELQAPVTLTGGCSHLIDVEPDSLGTVDDGVQQECMHLWPHVAHDLPARHHTAGKDMK
jgi:hypothetical protein